MKTIKAKIDRKRWYHKAALLAMLDDTLLRLRAAQLEGKSEFVVVVPRSEQFLTLLSDAEAGDEMTTHVSVNYDPDSPGFRSGTFTASVSDWTAVLTKVRDYVESLPDRSDPTPRPQLNPTTRTERWVN
jgi:hypothetical protein